MNTEYVKTIEFWHNIYKNEGHEAIENQKDFIDEELLEIGIRPYTECYEFAYWEITRDDDE